MSPSHDLRAVQLVRVLAELHAIGETQFDALFGGSCLVGPKSDEALLRDIAATTGVAPEVVRQALDEVDRRRAPERGRDDPVASLPLLPYDRYEEFIPIQAGGMGVVIRATDVALRRNVALKVAQAGAGAAIDPTSPFAVRRGLTVGDLTIDRHVAARLVHEALVTSHLEHPGIPAVHEVGRTPGGVPFFAMRLIAPFVEPGARASPATQGSDPEAPATFADRLRETPSGWPGREPLLDDFLRICDTVRFAHSQRILHLDLKPQNVVLGGFGEVVVVDWGMARLVPTPGVALEEWQERLREHDDRHDIGWGAQPMYGGTPRYMPPEGRLSEDEPETRPPDATYDVWALGVILHEVLVGATPFAGARDLVEQRRLVRDQDIPSPEALDPTVPVGLARLCMRALRRRPAERGSVADLADGVRAWKREAVEDAQVRGRILRAKESLLAARTGPDPAGAIEEGLTALGEASAIRPSDPQVATLREDFRRARADRERGRRRRFAVRGAGVLMVLAFAVLALKSHLELQRERAQDYGEKLGSALNEGFAMLVDLAVDHGVGEQAREIVSRSLARIDLAVDVVPPGWGLDGVAGMHRMLADTGYEGPLGEREIAHLRRAAAIRDRNASLSPEFGWQAAVQWEHNLARFTERGAAVEARTAWGHAYHRAKTSTPEASHETDSSRQRSIDENLQSRCWAYGSRLERRSGRVGAALGLAATAYALVDPWVRNFEERMEASPDSRLASGGPDRNRVRWHLARCETLADAFAACGQSEVSERVALRGRTLARALMKNGDTAEDLKFDLAFAEISAGRRALDADLADAALAHAWEATSLVSLAGDRSSPPAVLWLRGIASTLRGRAYLRTGRPELADSEVKTVAPLSDLASRSRERLLWEVRRLMLRFELGSAQGQPAAAANALHDARLCLAELSSRDASDVETAAVRAEVEGAAASVAWAAGNRPEGAASLQRALDALPPSLPGVHEHAEVTRVRLTLRPLHVGRR